MKPLTEGETQKEGWANTLLAFATREDLENALLQIPPDLVMLIGYVNEIGDAVQWTPKMDAHGRLITAPTEERVQQALLSDRARLVEQLEKERVAMYPDTMKDESAHGAWCYINALDKAISIIKESR
jgi:hypothetical protein